MRSIQSGIIIRSILSVSAVGIIVTTAILLSIPSSHKSMASEIQSVPLQPGELGSVLMRIGFGPQALAAAGVRGDAVTALINNTRAILSSNGNSSALNTAEDACKVKAEDLNRLKRTVQSNEKDDGDTQSQLSQARVEFTLAKQRRDSLIDAVYQSAIATLTNEQISFLKKVHSREDFSIPLPMRMTSHTKDSWPEIRDAYIHTVQYNSSDEDYNPSARRLINSIQAESQVSTATTNLELYLTEVQYAFDQALHGG